MPTVVPVEIARNLLVNRELCICLAQLKQRSLNAIGNDASDPDAVAILTALLQQEVEPGVRWLDWNAQHKTRVFLFPEYSFGSSDWEAIDSVVTAVDAPIVVIAGFGATAAGTLKSWAGATVPKSLCKFTFDLQRELNETKVNFGCCWVKLPADDGRPEVFERVLFSKNWPEQKYEAINIKPFASPSIARISFDDCDLFPVICSDLIQDATNDPKALSVREKIAGITKVSNKPALITGSLLQSSNPSTGFWKKAIRGAAECTNGHLLVALSNISCMDAAPKYDDDGRRNLSGIYWQRKDAPKIAHPSKSATTYEDTDLFGYPLRCGSQQFVFGVVRFPKYAVDEGLHGWILTGAAQAKNPGDGWRLFRDATGVYAYELRRHLPRVTRLQSAAISFVDDFHEKASHEGWCVTTRRILDGPALKQCNENDDPLKDEATRTGFGIGLVALNDLKSDMRFEWLTDLSNDGQLQCKFDPQSDATTQVAVWCNPMRTPEDMIGTLIDMADELRLQPPLVVLGRGAGTADFDTREFAALLGGTTEVSTSAEGLPALMASTLDGEAVRSTTSPGPGMRKIVALPLSAAANLNNYEIGKKDFSERMEKLLKNIRDNL